MSDSVLRVTNIKKSFGGVKALKGVSLEIKKGEIHCLAGENGCGKSTLIKIISGVYSLDEGEIEINGVIQSKINPQLAIAEGIQVIYQDFSIFPNLTVMENLSINKELAGKKKIINKKRMRIIAKEAISKINFEIDLDEIVENLSVAEKQLIAISRALLNDAKLIIMDEPTTALTKKEVKALFEIIKELQKQGIAILFVSHKLDEVFEISERFTILRNGANISSGDTLELDDKKFSQYMTGREFGQVDFLHNVKSNNKVLEVKNLNLKNGYKDINFVLSKGEILGITGLLGSGRTELAQSLFGYRKFDSGNIYIDGKEVKIQSVKDGIKNGIGYVPEDRLTEGLFLMQSIRDNISVNKWDEFSNKTGVLSENKINEEVEKWIKEFSIASHNSENSVQTLSGGNQQKCLLARWLSIDLKVLILNGPTVGVDIGAKYDIHAIIRRLARETGVAVIIISDDIPEVLNNSNRILIMREGMLVGEVESDKVSAEELMNLSIGA